MGSGFLRIIIAGGGTGGHIYPALAIAEGIKRRHSGAGLLYVGTSRGLESEIVPPTGLPFHTVPAAGLKRSLSPANLAAVLQAGRGLQESLSLVRRFRPHVVVGTGGYVCGPVVLAGVLRGIPTLIHEQNALPGLTNRMLARYASRTAVTFVDAAGYFPARARIILTGLPVRPEILNTSRHEARRHLGLPEKAFVLLSFGGSRGARSLNQAMIPVVQAFRIRPDARLFHATGTSGYGEFAPLLKAAGSESRPPGNIVVAPYFHDIAALLGAADLVICRSGASTIAELTVLGLPSILAPYPFATGNHQEYNARALSARGAALLIPDRELTGERLLAAVTALLNEPRKLAEMGRAAKALGKPRALDSILDTIEKLAGKGTR